MSPLDASALDPMWLRGLRLLPRRGRFRLACFVRLPGSAGIPVKIPLRGGLTVWLDLTDHLQRAIAADCHERAEEDVTCALLGPGEQVVDVGANIGYNSLRWAQVVGPHGEVHAFEPAPPNYDALLNNIALNPQLSVTPQRLALGDHPCQVNMSSDRPGATAGSYSAFNATPGGFEVEQVTLDDWAKDRDLRPLGLIKIDVEGWECHVLAGGRETVAKYRPSMVVEWNPGHDHGSELREELLHLKTQFGYDWFLIGRTRATGRGRLHALPTSSNEWPRLCNLFLRPR